MISKLLNHPRHPFLLLFATCAGLLGFGGRGEADLVPLADERGAPGHPRGGGTGREPSPGAPSPGTRS